MARARRRSTRNTATTTRASGSSPLSSSPSTPEPAPEPKTGPTDSCPGCTSESRATFNQFEKENWICCDVCKDWYHWRCAVAGEEDKTLSMDKIDKWFCKTCLGQDSTRTITFKAPTRRSDRKRNYQDYANLSLGLNADPERWQRMLDNKKFKADQFKRMEGADVNLDWLEEDDTAMTEPILIEKPDGLGMKMPDEGLSVEDVAQLVGEDVPVEVVDVATQSASPGWNLGKWADYVELEPSAREKIYNVISLEVSGTELGNLVLPPKLVRDLDWVDNFWPSTRKGKGHPYPKVQLYCLMGVKNAWTDWHIDFAGSSVYYHILSGSKVFYFIKPTPANLAAYEKWSGTELQNTWLGDMVDEVVKVVLTAGNTMIIPSGWIHAVFTPVDTIVFGGNFLHSYAASMQLNIRKIEIATHVPKKFRFPLFTKLCWYVGDKYLRDLKGPNVSYPSRVLSSLLALAEFLVSEVRILERGTEQAKKEVREQIPSDRVKDAATVARELRWRVRLAAGNTSDDESNTVKPSGSGVKRKRGEEEEHVKFKNFRPRRWDNMVEQTAEEEPKVLHAPKPTEQDSGWKERWIDWANEEGEDGDEVRLKRRTDKIVRVRLTNDGLERQRIERVVESWAWW
ncbi:Jumonji superfamily protein [Mycena indigotica]|uniref:JmjC domain-containing histone demethylation protein 1 n=1 Tax=Mycena indigotica TaxID=2126181 RepID=A0A8H6SBB2_9AGAR|nr:Jumonji superfamily protein [Mycena indigotica]KAF7295182.1 Jumonji superfamily protein [Mycena indigotica]